MKNLLKSLGGWPVVEGGNWDRRNFDWIETLISIRKLGYNFGTFLYLIVQVDVKNTSRHIIDVSKMFSRYPLTLFKNT